MKICSVLTWFVKIRHFEQLSNLNDVDENNDNDKPYKYEESL